MSWDDDSFADGFGERHPGRRATRWQIAGQAAGYVGLVVGVIALLVAAVMLPGVLGLGSNPAGSVSTQAHVPRVALPPMAATAEPEDAAEADAQSENTVDGLTGPPAVSGSETGPIDPDWTARTAEATGIPQRALAAYAQAHGVVAREDAECGVDWATIAAIGAIESNHGRHGGASLDDRGRALPEIIGRALDGNGVATITDTDGGRLDGDTTWDRAVGPMQFIPSTWAQWASDADGDGVADPHQIDDAAETTARYLCASGSMRSLEGWRAAIFSYNRDGDYVDAVARVANEYAAAVG